MNQSFTNANELCCALQQVDELAEIAMTAHYQQGEHDKALEAAQLIR